MSRCVCGADLSADEAVDYLSGDKVRGHIEKRKTGVDTAVTVFVFDDEGECDSVYWCAACGERISDPDTNEMWD